MDTFSTNRAWYEWIIWSTWKRHQRSTDSHPRKMRGKWCRKTNTSSSSQAWWVRSDRSSGNHQNGKRSTQITDKLTAIIYTQELYLDFNSSDQQFTRHTKNKTWQEKNAKTYMMIFWRNWPLSQTTHKRSNGKRSISLPNKMIRYALSKQEFTAAICMRYGWKVKGIPTHCACGETNSVDHSFICKLGGYTSMRHNSVTDSWGTDNERGL